MRSQLLLVNFTGLNLLNDTRQKVLPSGLTGNSTVQCQIPQRRLNQRKEDITRLAIFCLL